jgi:hypothetical protein
MGGMTPWMAAAAAAMVAVSMTMPAQAQYTCTGADGRKSFQDVPCPTSQKSEKLTIYQGNSVGPASDRPEHIRQALAQRVPAVGMTVNELVRVFGQPEKINSSVYGNRSRDQLIYRKGADTWYVYTDDDIVSAIQHRPDTVYQGRAPSHYSAPQKQCPSAGYIRDLEVEASKLQYREKPAARAELLRRIEEAKACAGKASPSFGRY